MAQPSIIDTVNKAAMASDRLVTLYTRNEELWPAERAIYDRVRAEVAGRPILDLGVGAGRTVRPLLDLSADYVGVDYTPEMVAVCRRRYPGVRFEQADARDLSLFAAGHFALVVFSCCGLGMVSHDDRLRILAEVRRVLVPGGAFAFSHHNRASPEARGGFALPAFEPASNPLRMAMRTLRFGREVARALVNHARLRRFEVVTPEYAILNDRVHEHATLLYYITLDKQRAQLVDAGFQPGAEAYDLSGALVTGESTDNALCLLARTRT
jgi:SAM-dependent methyltransferase